MKCNMKPNAVQLASMSLKYSRTEQVDSWRRVCRARAERTVFFHHQIPMIQSRLIVSRVLLAPNAVAET